MDSLFYTLTQSVVQALTEFLPVSSSGHLLMVKHLFGLENPGLVLDLTLHVGTTLCVGIYLWRHRDELIHERAAFRQLLLYALITTGVTGVMGLYLSPWVHAF